MLFIDAHGSQALPSKSSEVGTVASKPLVSGELRARRNMFRYGRYEVRMKAPDVQPGDPDVNGHWDWWKSDGIWEKS